MRGLQAGFLAAGLALAGAALAGCGDAKKAVAEAEAASGEALQDYSRKISNTVDLAANPDLVQRFCKNAFSAACPADITDTLKEYGYVKGTGIDLAQAFVVMLADQRDNEPDMSSSDEDYLAAAYQVALGRAPDEGGGADNLQFIQDTGQRKTMLRSLLESEEFRTQS